MAEDMLERETDSLQNTEPVQATPEFKNLDGKIDLHLESNGTTGIGTLSGGMTIKKLVRCQFDLDLIFDVATGQVLTIEGQVCDQSLVAEDLVVPFLL